MSEILLLFLGRVGGIERWLRLSDGQVAARGIGAEPLPPQEDPIEIAAIVPGEDVALHWVELPPGLAPAQASAAARLLAADLTAQPIEELHVAAGPDAAGLRCVAIVPALRMESWISTCRMLGRDPDMVLPEPLLLLPREGAVVRLDKQPLPLFRGMTDAFSIEPELAQAALGGIPVEPLTQAAFDEQLAEVIAQRPVDLRQGAFAKARKWTFAPRLVRRLALLAASILLLGALIQITSILRYTFAADRLESEAAALARSALPPGTAGPDPVRRLNRRLIELQGAGSGFGVLATGLFEAVRATPNIEIAALVFEAGALRATMVADTPATLASLATRLQAQGYQVENGAASVLNGRQSVEIIVRGR